MDEVRFRDEVTGADMAAVRGIVGSSGFFSAEEIDVAEELVRENLTRGLASGYFFVLADDRCGQTLGYACYGPVPCTAGTFDLYWIAVRQEARKTGLGRALLAQVEARVSSRGGRKLIAETSSRPQYEPTRAFYLACGFQEEARIREYYAPGEDILYFTKTMAPHSPCGT